MTGPMFNEASQASGREMQNVRGSFPPSSSSLVSSSERQQMLSSSGKGMMMPSEELSWETG